MTRGIFVPADIIIPENTDMTKWSVIACDQFSSEPSYWKRVIKVVGDSPSTLHFIIPEALIVGGGAYSHEDTYKNINTFLQNGQYRVLTDSFVYIERTICSGKIRRGLIGAVDLDAYDYAPDTVLPIRASERTIADRLPPRMEVRRGAMMEMPHIMALINDKARTVIEPLAEKTDHLEKLYDFDLMESGGHIRGWRVNNGWASVVTAAFAGLDGDAKIIVGDGNHSLATAKECWEEIKQTLTVEEQQNHPARFSLVELNNVYDPAIEFRPIHRVVFGVDPVRMAAELEETLGALPRQHSGYPLRYVHSDSVKEMTVHAASIGEMIRIVQTFLDRYVERAGGSIDYIHGSDSVCALCRQANSIGLILPAMDKSDFFATVLNDGIFPKKSFSIGHAVEKRYYLECRKIK